MDAITAGRFRLLPMRPRDPNEPERPASTLELFFDLVFVVAVSSAAVNLHHGLAEGHFVDGVGSYLMVFFAIWWAWMNFTWFATSFDTDDWLYRVLTILQMAGVLVLAAGVEPAFHQDFAILIVGYVVMRIAMVCQWLRASKNAGKARRAALTYAAGITAMQVLWVGWLFLMPSGAPATIGFLILVVGEILVPVAAERYGPTPWHTRHITERYGLFTLILLGESLLASANAIIGAVGEAESLGPLISIAVLTLVVTAGLWWVYFWPPHHHRITSLATALRYGYVHYFVFAAAGAFSAGVEVEIDVLSHKSHLGEVAASLTVTIPIAVFLLGIWWIAIRDSADRLVNTVLPLGALLVLLDPLIPVPITLTAIIMVVIVAVLVMRQPVMDRDLPPR